MCQGAFTLGHMSLDMSRDLQPSVKALTNTKILSFLAESTQNGKL